MLSSLIVKGGFEDPSNNSRLACFGYDSSVYNVN